MKERIERLTREIEARNAACKQYAYDIACLTDRVRALQVKIGNLTMAAASGIALVPRTTPSVPLRLRHLRNSREGVGFGRRSFLFCLRSKQPR